MRALRALIAALRSSVGIGTTQVGRRSSGPHNQTCGQRWLCAWRCFPSGQTGATATFVALAFPVVAVGVLGALDVTGVLQGRIFLQGVADAAALSGARQLGFDQSGATSQRTIRAAQAQAAAVGSSWTLTTTAQANVQAGTMTVTIDGSKPSIAGTLILPNGWHVHVVSTAVINAQRPLCVLATNGSQHDVVRVQDQSRITSPACLLQSNNDITVDNGAAITAGEVRAATSATGSISPAALTNAPLVADPFTALAIDIPTTCTDSDKLQFTSGTQSLNPGVHCGNVNLDGTANLTLNPGEHYFIKGNFHLTGSAQLTGSDVTLIFKSNFSLKFDQSASMSLEGRQSGPYAGFVLITSRAYTGKFQISTDRARKLLGTIYLPNATLAVTGTNTKVADLSPWTVVVASAMDVSGSANLVVNSNYSTSAVPVPIGVGPSGRGSVRLSN